MEPDPVETGEGRADVRLQPRVSEFPKTYIDGPQQVRVPVREIALSGGEPPLRVYDTSGPQDHDVEQGLPKLREPWVKSRSAPAA